jgi:hypothetical protein
MRINPKVIDPAYSGPEALVEVPDKMLLVDRRVYEDRHRVCLGCNKLKGGKCEACGCPVPGKLRWVMASCPEGKWGAVQKKVNLESAMEDRAAAYFESAIKQLPRMGVEVAPVEVIRERLGACSKCSHFTGEGEGVCGVNKCSSLTLRKAEARCPIGRWGVAQPYTVPAVPVETGGAKGFYAVAPGGRPGLATMAKSLASSLVGFVAAGMPVVSEEQLQARLDICRSCEKWDASGFKGTGRCSLCGCSTQAKLRMATSECPIKKWGRVG